MLQRVDADSSSFICVAGAGGAGARRRLRGGRERVNNKTHVPPHASRETGIDRSLTVNARTHARASVDTIPQENPAEPTHLISKGEPQASSARPDSSPTSIQPLRVTDSTPRIDTHVHCRCPLPPVPGGVPSLIHSHLNFCGRGRRDLTGAPAPTPRTQISSRQEPNQASLPPPPPWSYPVSSQPLRPRTDDRYADKRRVSRRGRARNAFNHAIRPVITFDYTLQRTGSEGARRVPTGNKTQLQQCIVLFFVYQA